MTQTATKWETLYPTNRKTGERPEVQVSEKDYLELKERGYERDTRPFTVLLKDGRKIRLRAASCGADCFCDATFVWVEKSST